MSIFDLVKKKKCSHTLEEGSTLEQVFFKTFVYPEVRFAVCTECKKNFKIIEGKVIPVKKNEK